MLNLKVPSYWGLLLFVLFNYTHRAKWSTQFIDTCFSPRKEKVIYLQELYIFFRHFTETPQPPLVADCKIRKLLPSWGNNRLPQCLSAQPAAAAKVEIQQQGYILPFQPVSMGKEPSHWSNVFSMQNCRRSDILKVLTFVFFCMNRGIHFLNLLTGCLLETALAITVIIKCFKIWKFYIEYNAQITFVWKMIATWALEPLLYCSRKTDYDRFQAYLGNNITGRYVFIC